LQKQWAERTNKKVGLAAEELRQTHPDWFHDDSDG